MPRSSVFGWLLLALVVAGCGKPPQVAVTGVVTFKGKGVPGCKAIFYPDVAKFDPNRHGGGYGMTREDGSFEIQSPDGTPGIMPGSYKVLFEAWVDSKGKAIPPTAKPSEVEGGVKNLLPARYASLADTPERATVTGGGGEFAFEVQ